MSTQGQKWTVRDVAPVGTWDADQMFEITGKEFEFLHNFSQMMQSLPMVSNGIYQKALQGGKIKTQYLYPDGSTATDEHIKEFKSAMDAMQSKISARAQPKTGPAGQVLDDKNEQLPNQEKASGALE